LEYTTFQQSEYEGDSKYIFDQHQPFITKLYQIETQLDCWNLPNYLAETAYYQRETLPGVLIEGWLYKKSSSVIYFTAMATSMVFYGS
jgi:hypothetical protein